MTPLVDLQSVTVMRDGNPILRNLTLQIGQGQHTAILGPNGSGKSTLVRVLAHEIYPYAGMGHARILGEERWSVKELRRVLGMVSMDVSQHSLGNPTAIQMAVSGLLGTYGVVGGYNVSPEMWESAQAALDQMEIGHLAKRTFASLSTGEQKRALIARALANHPRGLVLDEPTSGLDMRASAEFLEVLGRLADHGTTLILVTHHIEEVLPQIQQVAMLKGGELAAVGSREAMMTPNRIADLYDVPLQLATAQLNLARERSLA